MQLETPPQEVIDNHPHILRFVDADNEILPPCFISIEQQLHMEANSYVSAIYYLFVTHYIFNMSYNTTLKDVMFFIQEKIFKILESTFKKSAV